MARRDIKGKTAVITGAASGIGRAIALALAKEKCTILLADINEARLKETCEMVNQLGGKGEIFLCDVSKLDDVMRMAEHCFNSWGKRPFSDGGLWCEWSWQKSYQRIHGNR